MPTPTEVKPLDNYRLWIKYSDGVEGIVDFSDHVGVGVFAQWRNYQEFQKVHLGQHGELAWNDEIEICSDAMYLKITGKKPEDVFSINQTSQHIMRIFSKNICNRLRGLLGLQKTISVIRVISCWHALFRYEKLAW
jgi:hypothetical protein